MRATLIDDFLPVSDFDETHAIEIVAEPEAIFRAVREVTVEEVALLRTLLYLRFLPSRLGNHGGSAVVRDESLFEQMIRSGFVPLAETPNQEIVLGHIGQFWRVRGASAPHVATPNGFREFDDPSYAKAALSFRIEKTPAPGSTRLCTETRIHVPGRSTRRRFSAYWRMIRPWSGLIRRQWLKAIKRRAES